MDRRTSIATLFGRTKTAEQQPLRQGRVLSGLDPYAGSWGFEQSAHLLRRTTYGATYQQIKDMAAAGLTSALGTLLADQQLPSPPINYADDADSNVNIGESWIDAPYTLLRNQMEANFRTRSLYAWQMKTIFEEELSIREKMTLFWQNHYVTSNVNDPKFNYRKNNTLRTNALGNFRELTKEIVVDPSMLRFLNGNQNRKQAPNENFARELLELFTIGKGQPSGPGDYGTYTEQDVKEIARALTGWRDYGYRSTTQADFGSVYVQNRHDTSTKQLSHRFNNVQITDGGENEYKEVVDIIFMQDAVARFICRQLYIWFVYYEIDADAEQNVIEPMAQILIANDYEIKPALRALLESEHFYDVLNIGCVIRNPIDFTTTVFRQPDVDLPNQLIPSYEMFFNIYQFITAQDLHYFQPPSVAGWKAYHQEPSYYRIWINSVTLPQRMLVTDLMAYVGFEAGGQPVIIDVLGLVASLDNALNPNELIEELTNIFLPRPITSAQSAFLKSALIPGLPDFEWTVEYDLYLQNPSDPARKASVELKLRNLLATILKMPEFYLS